MSSNQFQRLHRLRQQADANLIAQSRRQREPCSAEIPVPAVIKPFSKVISYRNLVSTACELRAEGIKAPGPDNVRWDQVSRSDLCRLMSELSAELRQGEYFPSEARI